MTRRRRWLLFMRAGITLLSVIDLLRMGLAVLAENWGGVASDGIEFLFMVALFVYVGRD